MYTRFKALLLLLCSATITLGQQKPVYQFKVLQFSMAPGLGSNGLHPGGYVNGFSFNLTSGYSAANHVLEVGGISNLNTEYTKGLQVAGIFNLTGGNAFAGMNLKEAKKKINSGFEANLEGLQVSGVANVVITNVFGGQMTGGVNYIKGGIFGIQTAGLANVVEKYGFGVQLAGAYNSVVGSFDGVQLATLLNYTGARLQGLQLGGFNQVRNIEGRNSFSFSGYSAVQLGLVNRARKMNGLQIGLVNFGGAMQGTQIGLINFYHGGKEANTKDGTSIGLLNIGHTTEVLVYADELFFTNYQLSTGTLKNGRKLDAVKWIHIQNAIIFGYNPDLLRPDNTQWALGYGLYKKIFNRSITPGMNQFRFISGGLEFLHYNEGSDLNEKLNLISRLKASAGTRLHPKLQNIYVFGGLSYSMLISRTPVDVRPGFLNDAHVSADIARQRWAGGHVGIMIH